VILTAKQDSVLTVIVRGNSDGSNCDLDQVIGGVFYKTNKPSIQFIIRNLIGKNLITKQPTENRRTRRRIIFCATEGGFRMASRKRSSVNETLKRVLSRDV